MLKRLIVKDAVTGWVLLSACLVSGIVLNEMRAKPLPLVYAPPAVRLDQSVENLAQGATFLISKVGDVDLDEMKKISSSRSAVILDARPDIFFRLSHIPSAMSLPRDDFENRYRVLEPLLHAQREGVVVVYCSGNDCEDSRMVGDALERLGYLHVRIFRGGWNDWEGGNLPEERE